MSNGFKRVRIMIANNGAPYNIVDDQSYYDDVKEIVFTSNETLPLNIDSVNTKHMYIKHLRPLYMTVDLNDIEGYEAEILNIIEKSFIKLRMTPVKSLNVEKNKIMYSYTCTLRQDRKLVRRLRRKLKHRRADV